MTVTEVTERKATLETTMKESQTKLKGLKPFSEEFDTIMAEYLKAKSQLAKIDDEFAKAKADEATNAVKSQCATIAISITKLIAGLEIEKLISEPVRSVVYVVDSEGKASVTINKVTKLRASGTPGEGKGKGHTKIVDGSGNEHSITGFIKAHATADELKTDAYKYPHTVADTKAKFDEFCKAHNLTGYEYRLPVKTDEVTS